MAQIGEDPLLSPLMWLLVGLRSTLAVAHRHHSLTLGPLQKAAYSMTAGFPQSEDSERERGEREREGKIAVTVSL